MTTIQENEWLHNRFVKVHYGIIIIDGLEQLAVICSVRLS